MKVSQCSLNLLYFLFITFSEHFWYSVISIVSLCLVFVYSYIHCVFSSFCWNHFLELVCSCREAYETMIFGGRRFWYYRGLLLGAYTVTISQSVSSAFVVFKKSFTPTIYFSKKKMFTLKVLPCSFSAYVWEKFSYKN